jgi:hypothetical protein
MPSTSHDAGAGVRISTDGGRTQLEITVSVLRAHFSDRLVGALFRAFAASDRLASLEEMLIVNREKHPADSTAWQRNVITLRLYAWATMREAALVLDDLSSAEITRALRDEEPWLRLKELRNRWTRPAAHAVRNKLGFHLRGKGQETKKGLDGLQAKGDRVVLVQHDETKRFHMRHPVGEDLLFAAAGIEQDDLANVVARSSEDGFQMGMALLEIAKDMLKQCGADV